MHHTIIKPKRNPHIPVPSFESHVPVIRRRRPNEEMSLSQSFSSSAYAAIPNPPQRHSAPNSQRAPIPLPIALTTGKAYTPHEIISQYGHYLTNYEIKEIANFPEIFFIGIGAKKIEPDPNDPYNQGFDEEHHRLKLIVGDHLAYRYEVKTILGKGTFGRVALCYDHKLKVDLAIKVLPNSSLLRESAGNEAKMLTVLNAAECPYIVSAFDYFVFRNHACISLEKLGISLYDLYQKQLPSLIPMKYIRQYSIQILTALSTCHRNKIIHCDIKPENVLLWLDSKSQVKIIDFGSSCRAGKLKYSYAQSRYYRAPEVILGSGYDIPIDIWSFATTIVELATGHPLFPAHDDEELLQMIYYVLGEPPLDMVQRGRINKFIAKENSSHKYTLEQLVPVNDEGFIDLIKRCIQWRPEDRLTADQALTHPWIISTSRRSQRQLPGLKK